MIAISGASLEPKPRKICADPADAAGIGRGSSKLSFIWTYQDIRVKLLKRVTKPARSIGNVIAWNRKKEE
jgi:hypothetical protein